MLSASGNQSNTILFDIQPVQTDSVIALARQQGLPIDGTVPIVNMRLEKVNDITVETLEKDSTIEMHQWIFNREYRVTFRDSLTPSEKIAKGKWSGTVDTSSGTIFISLEERFAKNNSIDIGDTMIFNVQGSVISTIVGSLRVGGLEPGTNKFPGCFSYRCFGRSATVSCIAYPYSK